MIKPNSHSKIAIIGAGNVGASAAYALALTGVVGEVMLVDINEKRCQGEVLDISDASFVHNCKVNKATPAEAGQADIIVFTAGAAQRPGETRIALLDRNYNILKSVINGMQPISPKAILLIVANPCDIMAYFALKLSGLPAQQVLGSGTVLDTMRLRTDLADSLSVAETAVHAYVLGEHGDSQFVAWQSAKIGGAALHRFPGMTDNACGAIAERTKKKAYNIIQQKGSTHFGVAACVAHICRGILFNSRKVLTVSSYHEKYGVYTSLPAVVGINGVTRVIPIELSEKEGEALTKSTKAMKQIIDDCAFADFSKAL